MGFALSLIVLGFGYRVFVDAGKEKKGLKLLGKIIGVVMMIASLMGLACSTFKYSKCWNGIGGSSFYCPMKSKPVCPMTGGAETRPPQGN